MIKKDITIINELGIHARPAGMIANTCSRFACDIKLVKDGMEVNAKSIMGIITLGAGFETEIRIIAEGEDEEAAASAIELLFMNRFEEE